MGPLPMPVACREAVLEADAEEKEVLDRCQRVRPPAVCCLPGSTPRAPVPSLTSLMVLGRAVWVWVAALGRAGGGGEAAAGARAKAGAVRRGQAPPRPTGEPRNNALDQISGVGCLVKPPRGPRSRGRGPILSPSARSVYSTVVCG
jgi:hypothetical protein